jgi:hypothetical protein
MFRIKGRLPAPRLEHWLTREQAAQALGHVD